LTVIVQLHREDRPKRRVGDLQIRHIFIGMSLLRLFWEETRAQKTRLNGHSLRNADKTISNMLQLKVFNPSLMTHGHVEKSTAKDM